MPDFPSGPAIPTNPLPPAPDRRGPAVGVQPSRRQPGQSGPAIQPGPPRFSARRPARTSPAAQIRQGFVDRQQRMQAENRAEVHRAARSFGTRPLDPSRQPNVPADHKLRQGLLPLHPVRTRHADAAAGGNSWLSKFRVGRLLHRGLAWLQGVFRADPNQQASSSLTVQGLYRDTLVRSNSAGPLRGGMGNPFPPRPGSRTVVAGDRDLAMGIRQSPAYAVPDPAPDQGLFAGGAPGIADIRQADKRATCYFLSNLAATLAKPDGAERIQQMMHDHGDGTVTVRFRDLDVRVTKDRVVDAHGNDVFNRGAPWVRVMEKAFLGYRMAKTGNDVDIGNTAPGYRGGDRTIDDTYDKSQPAYAAMALAPLLKQDPHQIGALDAAGAAAAEPRWGQDYEALQFSGNDAADRAAFDKLDRTLAAGGSVMAGVSGAGKLFRRVLRDHVYAVLGPGVRTNANTGQQEAGYWVFDPYGRSVGAVDDPHPDQAGDDGSLRIASGVRGRDARFFVSRDQFSQLFGEVQAFSRLGDARAADADGGSQRRDSVQSVQSVPGVEEEDAHGNPFKA
jgi:hypothetical protein